MSEPDIRPDGRFRTGRWDVEPEVNRLCSDEEIVSLEPKTMAVLICLAGRAGQLVSTDELIESIWQGRPMGDNPVYKCIAQLRRALGDDSRNPAFIETIPKRGYRFIAEVRPPSEPAGTQPTTGQAVSAETAVRSRWPDARFLLASMLGGLCVLAVAISAMSNGRDQGVAVPGGPMVVLPFSNVNGESPTTIGGESIRTELMELLRAAADLSVIDYSAWSDRPAGAEGKPASHLSGRVDVRNERVALDLKLADDSGQAIWQRQVDLHLTALPAGLEALAAELAIARGVEPPRFTPAGCGATDHIRSCQLYLMASDYLRLPVPIGKAREQAVDLLKQAVSLDPEFAAAHARLAMLWLTMDLEAESSQYRDQAIAALDRAQGLSPGDPETIAAGGILRIANSRHYCSPDCLDPPAAYRAAQADFRAALAMDPGLVWVRHWLVLALQGQGRFHEAFSQALLAYAQDPMHPLANLQLVTAYAGQGDIERARHIAEEYLAGHPQGARSMFRMLAWAASRHGFHQNSLEWQIRSSELEMDRASHADLILLARTLLALARDEDLAKILKQIETGQCELGNQPWQRSHVEARLSLLLAGQELDLAALESVGEALLRVARQEFGDPARWPRWISRKLGQIHLHQGRYDQVIALLEPLFAGTRPPVDQLALLAEVDAMQALAYSLQQTGQVQRGQALIQYSGELLESHRAQMLGSYPGLDVALARTRALMGRDHLALTALEQAKAGGSPEIRLIRHDPRWQHLHLNGRFRGLVRQTQEPVGFWARLAAVGNMSSAPLEPLAIAPSSASSAGGARQASF